MKADAGIACSTAHAPALTSIGMGPLVSTAWSDHGGLRLQRLPPRGRSSNGSQQLVAPDPRPLRRCSGPPGSYAASRRDDQSGGESVPVRESGSSVSCGRSSSLPRSVASSLGAPPSMASSGSSSDMLSVYPVTRLLCGSSQIRHRTLTARPSTATTKSAPATIAEDPTWLATEHSCRMPL